MTDDDDDGDGNMYLHWRADTFTVDYKGTVKPERDAILYVWITFISW